MVGLLPKIIFVHVLLITWILVSNAVALDTRIQVDIFVVFSIVQL